MGWDLGEVVEKFLASYIVAVWLIEGVRVTHMQIRNVHACMHLLCLFLFLIRKKKRIGFR